MGILPLGMHTSEQFLSIVHTSDIKIYTLTFYKFQSKMGFAPLKAQWTR